jgi:N-acetylneuraminic acid mutarotase
VLAVLRSEGTAKLSQRTLTFEERVSYQLAIEEVYWHHRIWPKERPDPKPSLDAVMSEAQLEKKVADYLRNSQALQDYWHQPITAKQLQAEMDRMAQHTKQPEVLHQLFEALGNDPFVIAECLARSVLAERLVTSGNAYDQSFEGELQPRAEAELPRHPLMILLDKEPLESWRTRAGNKIATAEGAPGRDYTLAKISNADECIDDTWTATSTANAPTARAGHTAVWTGSEMIVWGGVDGNNRLNSGGRYDPSTDTWTPTSAANAPDARTKHTAVWTGSEMIVWGGDSGHSVFNTGGRYGPQLAPPTSIPTPTGTSTPTPTPIASAGTGGRYNPSSDSWTATSTTNAPIYRYSHTAVWTGSEMIVWGGWDGVKFFATGGRYNPTTDSWTATSTANAPSARTDHTAVWTLREMIIWGGDFSCCSFFNTGGRYNPRTDSWTATSTLAPAGRGGHTAVWTGHEMAVWGGFNNNTALDTGGKYNPGTNSWVATSTSNVPAARFAHTAVWTGSEMLVWGGTSDQINFFNTGGRYNPTTDIWRVTSATNVPAAREFQTSVWTGHKMIVWGGVGGIGVNRMLLNTGGRYCAPRPTPHPRPTPP